MSIQWFPGHMAKSQREIVERLKLVDAVIELLDARIPYSSRNPQVDELIGSKPRLILLTKADLADPATVADWIRFFDQDDRKTMAISAITGEGVNRILAALTDLTAAKRKRDEDRGIKNRSIRTMIIGIPNVGKSALINRLVNKKVARTGDRPGVTKGQQWIRLAKGIELLDTPGILWPKFEDEDIGYRLAITGAIKDELLHFDDLALYAVDYLRIYYPGRIEDRYAVETADLSGVEIVEQIALRRGCLLAGGRPDFDKAAELLIRELRSGLLGRYCLEHPDMLAGDDDDDL